MCCDREIQEHRKGCAFQMWEVRKSFLRDVISKAKLKEWLGILLAREVVFYPLIKRGFISHSPLLREVSWPGSKLYSVFKLLPTASFHPVLPWSCQKPLVLKLILSCSSLCSCFRFSFGLSIPPSGARATRHLKRFFDVLSNVFVAVGCPLGVYNLKAFEFTMKEEEVQFWKRNDTGTSSEWIERFPRSNGSRGCFLDYAGHPRRGRNLVWWAWRYIKS